MCMYCAIIGDIVDSRKSPDRQALQDRFQQTLSDINGEYDEYLASNLTITLGDECQGLMSVNHLWYEVIQKIIDQMAPARMRFGVGVGPMSTQFDKHTAIGADGQPYWSARQMLDMLKKDRKARTILYHAGTPEDILINALLACIEAIRSGRTDKQAAAARAMDRYKRQETAAQALGINQSAVSQRLQSARYYELIDAEEQLARYLTEKKY